MQANIQVQSAHDHHTEIWDMRIQHRLLCRVNFSVAEEKLHTLARKSCCSYGKQAIQHASPRTIHSLPVTLSNSLQFIFLLDRV